MSGQLSLVHFHLVYWSEARDHRPQSPLWPSYDAATMTFAMNPLVALAVLLVALPAHAADYPSVPDEMDK
jgi:hypothetical protein